MKSFAELGIRPRQKLFSGDKIKIVKILNCKIRINDFQITTSQYPRNKSGKCLTIQIEHNGEPHIVFSGSDVLIDMIEQVPPDAFPLEATIVKIGDHFEFR